MPKTGFPSEKPVFVSISFRFGQSVALPPILPAQRPRIQIPDVIIACRIAGGIIGIAAGVGCSVFRNADPGQQVQPFRIPISIRRGFLHQIGDPVIPAPQIAIGVVSIVPDIAAASSARLRELALRILGIARRADARLRLLRDVPQCVVLVGEVHRGKVVPAHRVVAHGGNQPGRGVRAGARRVVLIVLTHRRRHRGQAAERIVAQAYIRGIVVCQRYSLRRQPAVRVVFVAFLNTARPRTPNLTAEPVCRVVSVPGLQPRIRAAAQLAPDQPPDAVVTVAIRQTAACVGHFVELPVAVVAVRVALRRQIGVRIFRDGRHGDARLSPQRVVRILDAVAVAVRLLCQKSVVRGVGIACKRSCTDPDRGHITERVVAEAVGLVLLSGDPGDVAAARDRAQSLIRRIVARLYADHVGTEAHAHPAVVEIVGICIRTRSIGCLERQAEHLIERIRIGVACDVKGTVPLTPCSCARCFTP